MIDRFAFLARLFVNYFMFGSIPPRFEEGYDTHVNCYILIVLVSVIRKCQTT